MEFQRLQQFPNVAASAESVLVTDEFVGKSIHAIGIKMGGTTFTRAHITSLNIKVDGKDLLPAISGANLQKQNDYNGLDDDAEYLWYFFGDPTAQTIKGQHIGDLDLSVYRKPLEIRVNIGAATAPTLEAIALCGVPKMQLGVGFDELDAVQIGCMTRSVIQPSAAVSRKSYSVSLGSAAGSLIRRINYHHTNIVSIEHKKQGLIKTDDLTVGELASIAKNYGRVPQSGLVVLDKVVDGNQGEAESTINSDSGRPWTQEINLTTSGGDTITAYAELLASWPQI